MRTARTDFISAAPCAALSREAEAAAAPDFTSLLGRLLSDAALRAELSADPQALSRRLRLSTETSALLAQLDPAQLEAQAALLLSKRLHEALKLLPQSFRRLEQELGRAALSALFNAYAGQHWPGDHRRHIEDALNFGALLARQRSAVLDRAELNRLRFLACRRRLQVCVLRTELDGRRRPVLQLLWRHGSKHQEYFIYFGI
ncbi:hypothetical protein IT575_13480 [bacterium]|nr:hypothetical protein [bacterium]